MRYTPAILVLLAGALMLPKVSQASLKYSKLEKRPCIVCHETIQGKTLNKVGKCYQKAKSLAGCETK